MNYNDLTRRHFESPDHAGVLAGVRPAVRLESPAQAGVRPAVRLESPAQAGVRPAVRRGAAGSEAQGTWVQFDVQIGASQGETIDAVRFLAYGCPHVIAVSDWIAQQAVGREAKPALPESVQSLRERFDIPTEKLGRLLIVEDAWIAAVSSPHST
jgi:NifU-like protein involved in Fe-S cluster formation